MRRLASRLGLIALWGGSAWWLLTAPNTPLPGRLNPFDPIDLADPRSVLTPTKLRRALQSDDACLSSLATGAEFDLLPPLTDSEMCFIAPRVLLKSVGEVSLEPVETACETALRLAAWEKFALRPAAQIYGTPVARIAHQGSYNCRAIRGGTRMSTHATACAIDVRSVVFAGGTDVPLLGNWDGDGADAQFWRALRDGGCEWFTTTLGPDFNAAHADHLHLQSGGWGTCR